MKKSKKIKEKRYKDKETKEKKAWGECLEEHAAHSSIVYWEFVDDAGSGACMMMLRA